MNTAQLIVLWYAGLLVAGVLLLHTLDAGVFYLIAAIGLLAALTIYTLKPHPARKRWVVLGVLLPPMLLGFACWGYLKYTEHTAAPVGVEDADILALAAEDDSDIRSLAAARETEEAQQRAAEAAQETQRRAAEARQREADAAFLAEIKSGTVHDGRWLPVALDTDHIRHFVDRETIEVVQGQPYPLFGTLDDSGTEGRTQSLRVWVRKVDASDAPRDLVQLTVACRGRRVVGPHGIAVGWEWWAYRPGTISEEIVRWVERSKWCQAAEHEAAERAARIRRALEDARRSPVPAPFGGATPWLKTQPNEVR